MGTCARLGHRVAVASEQVCGSKVLKEARRIGFHRGPRKRAERRQRWLPSTPTVVGPCAHCTVGADNRLSTADRGDFRGVLRDSTASPRNMADDSEYLGVFTDDPFRSLT